MELTNGRLVGEGTVGLAGADDGLCPDVVCTDGEADDSRAPFLGGDASAESLDVGGTGEDPRLARVLEIMLELARRSEEAPKSVGKLSVLMECML
jgi:hypothetical protein